MRLLLDMAKLPGEKHFLLDRGSGV